MAKKEISYSEAMLEVEHILEALQRGDCDIDSLSERVDRASLLLALCRQRLRRTEEQLNHIFEEQKENEI